MGLSNSACGFLEDKSRRDVSLRLPLLLSCHDELVYPQTVIVSNLFNNYSRVDSWTSPRDLDIQDLLLMNKRTDRIGLFRKEWEVYLLHYFTVQA